MENLSDSLEDYLEAIYIINIDRIVVRVKELAQFLSVKTPSVVDAISKLEKKGLVSHEKYGYLSLSAEGSKIAKGIYKKHEYIYKFLNEVLNVDEESAEKDACGIEHHISKSTLEKIIKFMGFVEKNPGAYMEFIHSFKQYLEKENSSIQKK